MPLTLYSKWLRKGYERVMCERWVGDWTETATYWPLVPLSLAALLSRSARLLNRGPWGPNPLPRAGSHCLELQQLTPTISNCLLHRVISLFDVHLLPAPNSTRPQSRLYPDVFDRMHLFLDWWLGRRSISYIFPVWLTNDIQFLYQDVSIFDFSFLSTSFLYNGKQTFKPK